MVPKRWLKAVYGLLGIASAANGVWMLLAPTHWFIWAPGVASTGPFNSHLVRDFGACYALVGVVILGAVTCGVFTRVVHLGVTFFFALHATIHLGEFLAGHASREQLWVDFPGVYLPVAALLVFSFRFAWNQQMGQ